MVRSFSGSGFPHDGTIFRVQLSHGIRLQIAQTSSGSFVLEANGLTGHGSSALYRSVDLAQWLPDGLTSQSGAMFKA